MMLTVCPRCASPLFVSALGEHCPRCTGRLLLNTSPTPHDSAAARGSTATMRLGEYELGAELGRGAMGVVYRARQPRLRREVAVKVILASRFAGESARKRFLAEAELAAQLDHSNIVPIYEVGETPDGPFYAMKLIEGGTLASRMLNPDPLITAPLVTAPSRASPSVISNQFSVSSVAQLVAKIARAVHHAHERGVLHRDLKPGNILLDANGEPHVTDFGLARQLGAASSLTLSGSTLGTPAYMAPEQVAGERGVTIAADVWSLGAMLFHLLTGRTPFTGATATDVLLQVRTQEAPRLRSLNARIPADLETICLKCLEKDPTRRYTSARRLAEDLERWQRHEPIEARPVSSAERLGKWVRRHPARAAAILAFHIILLLGASGVLWQWWRAVANQTIDELVVFNANATATDADLPANALTFALVSGPPGLSVSAAGDIAWTLGETQGPSTNLVFVSVADLNPVAINANSLSVTGSFELIVREVNTPPSLTLPAATNISELVAFTANASATDSDDPANALTFALISGPLGLTVSPAGLINWTPTEDQGPGTNVVSISVTDTNLIAVNETSLSVTSSFQIVVNELNVAPVLTVPNHQNIIEETPLNVLASATDSDLPANALRFALISPPAGMAIDEGSGAISWTPTEAQGSNVYTVTVTVTDTNSPAINTTQWTVTNSFTVTVNESNRPPVLTLPPTQTIAELTTLSTNATATDPDTPANPLTFALVSGPPGLTVSPAGGISWTPTENQGATTNPVTISVTDANPLAVNATALSVTNSFQIVVNEVNVAPVLTVPANTNIAELLAYSAQATATDADVPANTLSFELVSGPAGLTVSPSGLVNWTPTEGQGPSTNPVTLRVTDLNLSAINATTLSDTNSFTIIVEEVNVPPVLPTQTNVSVLELTTLTITNAATDSDLPTNALTYALLDAPAGAAIDTNGVITWTPTEAQGPGTNTLTTVVADLNPDASNLPQFSVTNSFEVVVQEVNAAPALTLPPNTNINELVAFTAQATATDLDDPTNTLTFALVSGPAGLTVSPSGAITWTPTEEQGPGTNAVLIRVTDTNTLALAANAISVTNTFAIVVNEVNVAPYLALESVPPNPSINELVPYNFQLAALDFDVPTNQFTYQLISGPPGLTIATNGLVSWTPDEAQGPGSYNISFRVFDYSPQAINAVSLTNSIGFALHVGEINLPPVLAPLADQTVNPGQTISFLAEATDPDLPANTLTFSLLSAPAGATIDAASGAFSWRPGVALADTTNAIQLRVQDNGAPAFNDVKSFSVIIQPLTAPVLLTPLSYNSGVFTLSATGTLGPDYVLMVSTNLQQWTDLKTNLAPALPTPFTDPDAGSLPARVYRV